MVAPAPAGGVTAGSPGVLDALRRHLDAFDPQHTTDPHRGHILRRILACRTPAMGTHHHVCDDCGWSAQLYNSCRDRHW